jgi:hypothetical protein
MNSEVVEIKGTIRRERGAEANGKLVERKADA